MKKISYSLVFNRKKKLNKKGMALVQVEAYLNRRKMYFHRQQISQQLAGPCAYLRGSPHRGQFIRVLFRSYPKKQMGILRAK